MSVLRKMSVFRFGKRGIEIKSKNENRVSKAKVIRQMRLRFSEPRKNRVDNDIDERLLAKYRENTRFNDRRAEVTNVEKERTNPDQSLSQRTLII